MKASLIGDRDSTVSGKFVSCELGVQGQAADAQNRLNGVDAKIQQVKQLQQAGAATAPMIASLLLASGFCCVFLLQLCQHLGCCVQPQQAGAAAAEQSPWLATVFPPFRQCLC
jgi:hypothetical protein